MAFRLEIDETVSNRKYININYNYISCTEIVQHKVTLREKERKEREREEERKKENATSRVKSRRQSQLRDKFSARVSLAYAFIITLSTFPGSYNGP